MSLAVEAEQPVRDVLWLANEHPDVIETLHAYLQWRAEQNKQQSKRKGR